MIRLILSLNLQFILRFHNGYHIFFVFSMAYEKLMYLQDCDIQLILLVERKFQLR